MMTFAKNFSQNVDDGGNLRGRRGVGGRVGGSGVTRHGSSTGYFVSFDTVAMELLGNRTFSSISSVSTICYDF